LIDLIDGLLTLRQPQAYRTRLLTGLVPRFLRFSFITGPRPNQSISSLLIIDYYYW